MKFQVPQFVEVEDKLFWRLTLKQFIYLAGGAGLAVIIFLTLNRLLAIFIALPVIAFSLALAFYKINNRPFINFVEAATMYFLHDKLYIWRKVDAPITPEKAGSTAEPEQDATTIMPKMHNSKLKDMNWALDTKGAPTEIPTIEKELPKT